MEVRRVVALIIIMLVCSFAGFVASGPYKDSACKDAQPTKETALASGSESENNSADHADSPDCNPPTWYTALQRPEWWQVILAAIGIGVLAWQAFLTRIAAEASKVSSDSAKASADIASQNIEVFISKERARLRIDLKPLDLSPGKTFYTVEFTVTPYGLTPAFIAEAKCSAHEWPLNVINNSELMDRVMTDIHAYPVFPTSIAPEAKSIDGYTFLFLTEGEKWRDLMLSEVKAGRLFVVVRGVIKYKDVFDRERETRFRYVWKYSWLAAVLSPDRHGAWEKCGPGEQNTET